MKVECVEMDSAKLLHQMRCLFKVQSLILQKIFTEFWRIFFAKRDIELSYNNDGSIFWSKDGWKDIVENMQ